MISHNTVLPKGMYQNTTSVHPIANTCKFGQRCDTLVLTLTVLVTTIDAQWEGMRDVGSARYEPALLPPCPTIRVLSHSK